ncbi:MAG: DUF996 domain-containing protein [Candidatus Methanosuratus sp.]|nr:DUF996 domain-containing protein [Candidatus Methanosuratincola sp.]
MTLESNKALGGIGTILMLIGVMPFGYMGIIALIGLILVLVALYGFAGIYRERKIFSNFFYGTIVGIVGAVVAGAVIVLSFLTTLTDFLYQIFPDWNGDWSTLPGLMPDPSNIGISDLYPFLARLVSVILILWASVIIASLFVRRSLNTLSSKTNVGLFSTAGLTMLIGAFLTILLIGFFLIWISMLLIAIAFFKIKTQPEQSAVTVVPPHPMVTQVQLTLPMPR